MRAGHDLLENSMLNKLVLCSNGQVVSYCFLRGPFCQVINESVSLIRCSTVEQACPLTGTNTDAVGQKQLFIPVPGASLAKPVFLFLWATAALEISLTIA